MPRSPSFKVENETDNPTEIQTQPIKEQLVRGLLFAILMCLLFASLVYLNTIIPLSKGFLGGLYTHDSKLKSEVALSYQHNWDRMSSDDAELRYFFVLCTLFAGLVVVLEIVGLL